MAMNTAILTKNNPLSKNILWSVSIKALNIIFVFLITRRSIDLLGKVDYGIWTAITSLATWVSLMDIGVGNGLRVELRKCFIEKDWKEARAMVNTAYLFIGAICIGVLAVFVLLWMNVDWMKFFNISNYPVSNINLLVLFTMFGLILQLVLSMIVPVLNANLHSGLDGIFFMISNGILLTYLCLVSPQDFSILQYGVLASFLPVLTYLGFSVVYYFKAVPQVIPDFKETRFKKIWELMSLSGKFFFIQISAVLMYQMTSFLLIKYFDPIASADYSVARQYFNLFYVAFMTILQPLWSLSTDAYLRNDFDWIKKTMKKYMLFFIAMCVALVIGYFMRDYVFTIWLGKNTISPKVAFYTAIMMAIICFNNIFLYVVNGSGRIHFQFLLAIFMSILFFPVTHVLVKYFNLGIDGVFIGNIIFLLLFTILIPLQTYYLLNTPKKGIWHK